MRVPKCANTSICNALEGEGDLSWLLLMHANRSGGTDIIQTRASDRLAVRYAEDIATFSYEFGE